jgi:hypothetical protein
MFFSNLKYTDNSSWKVIHFSVSNFLVFRDWHLFLAHCHLKCAFSSFYSCPSNIYLSLTWHYKPLRYYALSESCNRRLLASLYPSVLLSLCPSPWNNWTPSGRIFMKVDNWVFFENLSRKSQFSLKSDKNNRYSKLRPLDIFYRVSLSSLNEKYFREKLKTRILCLVTFFPKIVPFIR